MRRLRFAALVALLACDGAAPLGESPPEQPPAVRGGREQVLGPFLSAHWQLPVAPQGPVPQGFSEVDASLDPEVCGACHPLQLSEWQTSLHAAAFSPGFAGQLLEGNLARAPQLRACQRCHAPLSEQQPVEASAAPNPGYDAGLRRAGITCAACHVRRHRRFGPPRREGVAPAPEPVAHGGFEARPEYLESRFCAECHQFFDDPGVAGKPLENTFVEWSASPQAAAGRQCQDCHMPDRAHLWRGIHDPEMVRGGVEVDLRLTDAPPDRVRGLFLLGSRDVGHAFPTYVTPRVFLDVYQVDAAGIEISDTRVSGVIGREVDLAAGVEISDTRVLPGQTVRLDYDEPRAPGAAALSGRVTVDPDYHYRRVFASLKTSFTTPQARAHMAEALLGVADSAYVLVELRRELALR